MLGEQPPAITQGTSRDIWFSLPWKFCLPRTRFLWRCDGLVATDPLPLQRFCSAFAIEP